MTNFGFHTAMREAGIEVATTEVGDRAVSEELRASRAGRFGGEQSGHLIWTAFAPTGDGIAAALLTLEALGEPRASPTSRPIERLPQTLENVADRRPRRARGRRGPVWEAVEAARARARGPRAGAGARLRAPSRWSG